MCPVGCREADGDAETVTIMFYGVLFMFFGVLSVLFAVQNGGIAWLMLWVGGSFATVGYAYLRNKVEIMGKRPDGSVSPLSITVLFPFLLYAWATWNLVRFLRREVPFHELTDNVVIGRRLLADEYPEGIDHVLDLTCEFSEPNKVTATRGYHCLPILDASVPDKEELLATVKEIADLHGRLYIHCAEGHGRTGMFSAAFLLYTGRAKTAEEAVATVREKRPKARLSAKQYGMVTALELTLAR